MNIHLIRHGTTYANEKKLYCGLVDSFVSPLGFNEIEDRKNAGLYKISDLYFTSELIRTHQTFSAIYGEQKFTALSEFNEFDFGILDMKTHEELLPLKEYQEWANPNNIWGTCPGGENNRDFNKRVMTKLHEIIDSIGKNEKIDISIVCHGGVIATIMETLFPDESSHFYRWLPRGGEGYIISFNEDNRNRCFSKIKL